jgi:signal transduction histidine kinase
MAAGVVVSVLVMSRGPDHFSPLWDGWIYNIALAGAAVSSAASGLKERAVRLASFGIAASIFCWFLGNLAWTYWVRPAENPPSPSFADLGYLMFYPPIVLAVLATTRLRQGWRNPVVLLDGLIAGFSVTAVAAIAVFGPIARAATGSRQEIVTNLAYPILDCLVVGLVLTLVALSGWRTTRQQAVLLGAIVLFATSDSLYLVRIANGTYVPSTLLDSGWIVSLLAMAWSQWMKVPAVTQERPQHARAVVIPVVFLAGALVVFIPSMLPDVPMIGALALVLALVSAGARMIFTLRQLERLAGSEREAREARIHALAQAQVEVEAANGQLEARVAERTADLVEANRRLSATADQLKRSNRELQEFAYVASHDLQEPLRKVQAFGSRLESRYGETLAEDGRDYLHRMQGAAGRMSTLIEDLLTFSRVASLPHGFGQVDLTQVGRDVVSDLEVLIEEAGATVSLGPMHTIDGDPTQLRQLLQNLVSNAIKFRAPDATCRVEVRSSLVEAPMVADEVMQNGPYCRLEVVDNGIGFDEKYLDRIFTVFQRLHGRGEYEGSGIGLAVCRRIVERHRGTVTATSAIGIGTTFIVHLPVRQRQEPL